MRRIGILFAIVVISGVIAGYIASQEAFAFSEPPTKDEKQFMLVVFLSGFVGIYASIIYLRKITEKVRQ